MLLVGLLYVEADDVEVCYDAFELIVIARVSQILGANIILQVLDRLRIQPEDSIVEKWVDDVLLDLVLDATYDTLIKITFVQSRDYL